MNNQEIAAELAYRIAEREAILSDGGTVTQQMRDMAEIDAKQWLTRWELQNETKNTKE